MKHGDKDYIWWKRNYGKDAADQIVRRHKITKIFLIVCGILAAIFAVLWFGVIGPYLGRLGEVNRAQAQMVMPLEGQQIKVTGLEDLFAMIRLDVEHAEMHVANKEKTLFRISTSKKIGADDKEEEFEEADVVIKISPGSLKIESVSLAVYDVSIGANGKRNVELKRHGHHHIGSPDEELRIFGETLILNLKFQGYFETKGR
jgi:hypothetical protein